MKYQPMLCKLGDKKDLGKKNYIYEAKVDGTRAVLHANREIILINRRNRNITHRYPEFSFRKNIKAESAVLDGEIVCYNEKGLPDFNLLQRREQLEKRYLIEVRAEQIPATFIVFDILEKDGKKLISLPLKKRKQILRQTIKPGPRLELMVFTDNGKKLWKQARNLDMEGVVAKKLDSKYLLGKRTRDWIKIKNMKTIDCIIVGYTREIRQISAFALACYSNKKLKYVGRVGTGFTESFIKQLLPKLEKLKTGRQIVEYRGKHKIQWVKPELVAEIKYLQITKDKILRVPVFLRLRDDKPPKDCILEEQI
jgi:DNA ligase D-like protein (predicted ligase)